MKHPVMFFSAGLAAAALMGALLQSKFARGNDPRANSVASERTSGVNVSVPQPDSLELGWKQKSTELEEKERRLQEAQERLRVEEARIEDKIQQFENLRAEVMQQQEKNKQQSDKIFSRMVKTYESMSPKKAAVILATLDDDLSVELLLTMKEKRVAQILDVMDADRAKELSSLMAKRRPTELSLTEKPSSQGRARTPASK